MRCLSRKRSRPRPEGEVLRLETLRFDAGGPTENLEGPRLDNGRPWGTEREETRERRRKGKGSCDWTTCDGVRARLNVGGLGGRDTRKRERESLGSELPKTFDEVWRGGIYTIARLCTCAVKSNREMGTRERKGTRE